MAADACPRKALARVSVPFISAFYVRRPARGASLGRPALWLLPRVPATQAAAFSGGCTDEEAMLDGLAQDRRRMERTGNATLVGRSGAALEGETLRLSYNVVEGQVPEGELGPGSLFIASIFGVLPLKPRLSRSLDRHVAGP